MSDEKQSIIENPLVVMSSRVFRVGTLFSRDGLARAEATAMEMLLGTMIFITEGGFGQSILREALQGQMSFCHTSPKNLIPLSWCDREEIMKAREKFGPAGANQHHPVLNEATRAYYNVILGAVRSLREKGEKIKEKMVISGWADLLTGMAQSTIDHFQGVYILPLTQGNFTSTLLVGLRIFFKDETDQEQFDTTIEEAKEIMRRYRLNMIEATFDENQEKGFYRALTSRKSSIIKQAGGNLEYIVMSAASLLLSPTIPGPKTDPTMDKGVPPESAPGDVEQEEVVDAEYRKRVPEEMPAETQVETMGELGPGDSIAALTAEQQPVEEITAVEQPPGKTEGQKEKVLVGGDDAFHF